MSDTLWFPVTASRLAAEQFWPAEMSIDLMLRDWGTQQVPFDWHYAGTTITDIAWALQFNVVVFVPTAWDWTGFGSFSCEVSLTLQGKITGTDRGHLRIGTTGTDVTINTTSYSAHALTGTFSIGTTAPTTSFNIPVYGYGIDNGSGGSVNVKRDVGIGIDYWRFVL